MRRSLAFDDMPRPYLNYLTDGSPAAVRAAYGPSFARLRLVKRRYDPGNVFRTGRNIPSD